VSGYPKFALRSSLSTEYLLLISSVENTDHYCYHLNLLAFSTKAKSAAAISQFPEVQIYVFSVWWWYPHAEVVLME
jgi:hypothetical protein